LPLSEPPEQRLGLRTFGGDVESRASNDHHASCVLTNPKARASEGRDPRRV
jgi:hypothetical protein